MHLSRRSFLSSSAAAVATLPRPASAAPPLLVVCTVPELAAIARFVGGEAVDVRSLAEPGQDPHFIDARPNLALLLSKADALVAIGLDLEVGWLPTLQTGARNSRILTGGLGFVDASTFVPVADAPHGVIDRSAGDVHPGGNPHYLRDPKRAVLVAQGLAGSFSSLRPEVGGAFRVRAALFAGEIGAMEASLAPARARLRGVPTLVYHRSWTYLAEWLGIDVVGEIEPKPGIPPSPAHTLRVLEMAKARGVRIVLQESHHPANAAEQLAQKLGARLVRWVEGPDLSAGEAYVDRITALVEAMAGGAP